MTFNAIESAALDFIAEQDLAMRKLLGKWVNINSGTFHLAGLEKQALELESAFGLLSDHQERRKNNIFSKINHNGLIEKIPLGDHFVMQKRRSATLQILFTGHYDTVYGPDHLFQSFTMLDNDRMNGPGAADMKGGLVALLTALQAFEQTSFKDQLGWRIVLNSDEEIGSPSSASIIENEATHCNTALVFEPRMNPEGTLAGERKGSGKFSIVVHGKSAHAGRAFFEGRNAIVAMSELLLAIDGLNDQFPGTTINIGNISGGKAVNVVPDTAVAHLDIRFEDPEHKEPLQNKFHQLSEKVEQNREVKIDWYGGFTRPTKPMTADLNKMLIWVQSIANELNQTLNWEPSGGCCDGNNIAACGIPVVDTLGVRGANIHSEKEFACLDSLVETAQLTCLILCRIAQKRSFLTL